MTNDKEQGLTATPLPAIKLQNKSVGVCSEWVGLTDEELEFYTEELGQGELGRGVLRAVNDFLKEKNT
jgi:hypothetical protein